MSLLEFIKSKLFFKHLLIALLSLTILFGIAFKYLNIFTLHNETIVVPDFSGVKINKLDTFIVDKNLNYLVIDSVFDAKKERGIVVKQDPEKGFQVKKGRTIYLYVTATLPPKVKMPKLLDKSLKQALATIESYGLKAGKISYVPDQCVNCVLQQIIKGKKVEPGTMIEKGSAIHLIVGKGLSDEETISPDLKGFTITDATTLLSSLSLNEGSLYFEEPIEDSLKARVYKQIPSRGTAIKLGSSIDLFLSNKAERFPLTDSLPDR